MTTETTNPTFVLDGAIVDRDDLGDPPLYRYSVDGTWKTDEELDDDDLEALYYSGNTVVHLRTRRQDIARLLEPGR